VLRAFQVSYASTAFRCRFPNCDRLSLGFATAELRLEHEAVHVQRVYCQTSSCPYNHIGFAKRSALAAHTRKHHGQSSMPSIPAKIRHTADAEAKTGAKAPVSQDSQGTSTSEQTRPPPMSQHPSQQRVSQQKRLAAAHHMLRQSPGIINATDSKAFPRTVLNPEIRANVPPDIKTWSQLKQWAIQNTALRPAVTPDKLVLLQALHFQDLVREQSRHTPQMSPFGSQDLPMDPGFNQNGERQYPVPSVESSQTPSLKQQEARRQYATGLQTQAQQRQVLNRSEVDLVEID
jgi:hypothetical protein